MLLLFNKPFRVLSQFQDSDGRAVLKDYIPQAEVYPAGRLDNDSEGLLLLTDNGRLQARISQPKSGVCKHYWAQVEGTPTASQLHQLTDGVALKDGFAKAVSATAVDQPESLWDREPPIRYRANVPDHWIEIVLSEGRNRQVRRMTAAVGLPTLRLIRHRIGPWMLGELSPGTYRTLSDQDAWRAL